MRKKRVLVILSATLAVASAVALAYASGELAGGLIEAPGHWWSAIPLLALAGSLAALAWAWWSGRPRSR